MKRKRLAIVFSIFCIIVFLCIFSSQIFKLKTIEIIFYDEFDNRVVNLNTNSVFNSEEKIENIIDKANFDYGNLVFLLDKTNYVSTLESQNPYLELKNIIVKFPNKLQILASERKPMYYVSSEESIFILDNTFKILEILSKSENLTILNNLTEISAVSSLNNNSNFFDFFGILPVVYEAGQNLSEYNKILQQLSNLYKIINNYVNSENLSISKFLSKIVLEEISVGKVNLKILTKNMPYGITLKVENIFSNFDKKLNKLLNALNTLKRNEEIKCSYGQLKIDDNLNCYWNNL